MNRTLEELAAALFCSWFVDFDPVVAKAAGRAPFGLTRNFAALFPSTFSDSELGPIPLGWRVAKVEGLLERLSVGRKYDQRTASISGRVPILDQGRSGIIGYHDDVPGVTASIDDPVIVFANHTCYTRLITYSFSAIQNVLPFRGKEVSTLWLFCATDGLQEFIEYKGHWPDLVIKKVIVPDPKLTMIFQEIVRPFFVKINQADEESRDLAALRDTLLPKLLSGELRVKDAEKKVATVV